jgi:hypothetical protein
LTLAKDLGRLLGAGVLLLLVMLGMGKLLVGVLLDGPVGRLDDRIELDLAQARTASRNALSQAGSSLADLMTVQVALVVLVVLIALLTRRGRASRAWARLTRSPASLPVTPQRRCACTAPWPSSPGASRRTGRYRCSSLLSP